MALCCHLSWGGFFLLINILMLKDMVDHWDFIKTCNSGAAYMTMITAGYGVFGFTLGLLLLILCHHRSKDAHE